MPELVQIFITFFKLGMFSFGGGYAMIPLMEKEVVQINKWLTFSQMVDIISVSQIFPGPIAINLASFVGFLTAGLSGAFFASLGVVLPSFVIVLVIANFYGKFKEWDVLQRIFKGIRPMAVALIGTAAFLIARTSLVDGETVFIAILSLFALKYTKVSPFLVILAAGLSGIVLFN